MLLMRDLLLQTYCILVHICATASLHELAYLQT